MDKSQILNTLEELKKNSKKRKFSQGIDVIIILKNLDIKKTENQFEIFTSLPHSKGRKMKICALVGAEMSDASKAAFDNVILLDDFEKYASDKHKIKRLAEDYDYFVGQANMMPKIAASFGKVFGPRKKMPNPASGCIVPPNANLKLLSDKLQKTVKISVKKQLVVQAMVATDTMKDDEISENVLALYNTVLHKLPNELQNIKSVSLKYTMSKPVKVK